MEAKFKQLRDNVSKYINIPVNEKEDFKTIIADYSRKYDEAVRSKYPDKNAPNEVIELYNFLRTSSTFTDTGSCLSPIVAKFGFESIAGMDNEKDQLKIYFIYPNLFSNLFKKSNNNIILEGPSGVGKSLLVTAAVKELPDILLFAPNPGSIRGKFEGETEKNIDNLFACASASIKGQYTRAIIFFDEFDAIAALSDDPIQGRTRAALLQNIDGISSNPKISIIAATNFIDRIDNAIRRRFSQEIFVNLPNRETRLWIIKDEISKNYNYPGKLIKCNNSENCHSIFSQNFSNAKNNLTHSIDIDKICSMTGPKPKAASQGDNKDEYSSSAVYEYGYSSSDLVKVMNLAVNKCSRRALLDNAKFSFKKDFYVYDVKGNISLPEISKKDYNKIISFDLKESDIIESMKDYKPTYNIEDYKLALKKL